MSRTRAKAEFTWQMAQEFLRARGVTLLSAGLDEVPMAYKDIDAVQSVTLSRSRGRLHRVLITLQTAAALVLLIGAGLLTTASDASSHRMPGWTRNACGPSSRAHARTLCL